VIRSIRIQVALTVVSVLSGLAVPGEAAEAAWHSVSVDSTVAATAREMPVVGQPAVSVSGRDVTVTWAAAEIGPGVPVDAYEVTRFDEGTDEAAQVGSGCTASMKTVSCVERSVRGGSWEYAVRTRQADWVGPAGPRSAPVDVAGPALTLSASTVRSLPAKLTAIVSGFVPGEAVTFRLDDPDSGTDLPASPPAGVPDGPHTVFGFDAAGDRADAGLIVTVGPVLTLSTPAFKVIDRSGTTASDVSSPYAFAADGRSAAVAAGPAFKSTAYLELDYADAVPAGSAVSGAALAFSLTPGGGATACMYFDVRRRSTGNVLATHGSRTAPVACTKTAQSTSIPLPEVTTQAVAGDLRIRVYATNSVAASNLVDLATVTASTPGKPSFTLYPTGVIDANGAAPVSTPWPLAAAGDGAALSSADGWGRAFDAARRLELTFPDYLPDTASSVGATLTHAYRSATAGSRSCWYFEVYAKDVLLAAHGSKAKPVSCNSKATTFRTDTVALPEVDTVAKAGSLVVRIYAKSSGRTPARRMTEHDLTTVTFTYAG
jgi:hypothetical protein